MRIGLLNNLRAGRSGRQVSRVLEVLSEYPHVHHVETNSVRAVPEALATLGHKNVDLLIINGATERCSTRSPGFCHTVHSETFR